MWKCGMWLSFVLYFFWTVIEADFAVFLCIIVLHECALNWAFGNTIDLVFCAILTKTNLTLGLEKENSMINF